MRDVGALLFDLGGVALEIDFNRAFARWAACSGTRIETIRSRFSFDAAYERHERGEIHIAEYAASLRATLGIDLPDDAFTEGWTPAFEAIAAEIGVRQEKIVFFDDTPENVEGARAAGLRAVHVRSLDDIRNAVAELLP